MRTTPVSSRWLAIGLLFVALPATALPAAAQLPRARANDHRTAAGQMTNGEVRIALEAVIAEWRPRGESGPARKALTFAEVGKPPSAPGPLIRVSAGVPLRITIRNTLTQPLLVGGLGDRGAARVPDLPRFGPDFIQRSALRLAPGETREVRFTPGTAVTSFYSARVEGAPADDVEIGLFQGAYIVDPAGQAPPLDERIMMISTGFLDEDSPTFKMFINGMSWPHTERLSYSVGDTVRWRVINTVPIVHPMHLHGFYFHVDARGDGAADTVYAAANRPLAVTDLLNGVATLRMSWVASETGNWLFHCHLIRHMGGAQRYAIERAADSMSMVAGSGSQGAPEHAQHDMAGLIMGITVRPRPGLAHAPEPTATRRLDLWSATRTGVHREGPGLTFVLQDGAVPAVDSTRPLSSTLELHEGEPTRIVVHNRLHFPLSLHWHGLELKSAYDGVGGWSGDPASPSRPIAPGDSMAVLITPPRAGTFMYHTHGEPGHELSQGLYGGFLVLPRGEDRDSMRDRLFMLASRGAVINAPPAINGHLQAPTEHFAAGVPVRLRFAHISADELKTVRLVRDGEIVPWRLLSKDGADLPAVQQGSTPARFDLGVGETRDVEWTPPSAGLYVLEVRTTYYPQRGGAEIQRVAFAVGDVAESAIAAAVRGTELPVVALDTATLATYPALYRTAVVAGETPRSVRVVRNGSGQQLFADRQLTTDSAPNLRYMIPLGDDTFGFGTFDAGVITESSRTARARFTRTNGTITGVELSDSGGVAIRLSRIEEPMLPETERRRIAGPWTLPGGGLDLVIERDGPGLVMVLFGERHPLLVDTPTRLVAPSFATLFALHLVREGDAVAAVDVLFPGEPPVRLKRKP